MLVWDWGVSRLVTHSSNPHNQTGQAHLDTMPFSG